MRRLFGRPRTPADAASPAPGSKGRVGIISPSQTPSSSSSDSDERQLLALARGRRAVAPPAGGSAGTGGGGSGGIDAAKGIQSRWDGRPGQPTPPTTSGSGSGGTGPGSAGRRPGTAASGGGGPQVRPRYPLGEQSTLSQTESQRRLLEVRQRQLAGAQEVVRRDLTGERGGVPVHIVRGNAAANNNGVQTTRSNAALLAPGIDAIALGHPNVSSPTTQNRRLYPPPDASFQPSRRAPAAPPQRPQRRAPPPPANAKVRPVQGPTAAAARDGRDPASTLSWHASHDLYTIRSPGASAGGGAPTPKSAARGRGRFLQALRPRANSKGKPIPIDQRPPFVNELPIDRYGLDPSGRPIRSPDHEYAPVLAPGKAGPVAHSRIPRTPPAAGPSAQAYQYQTMGGVGGGGWYDGYGEEYNNGPLSVEQAQARDAALERYHARHGDGGHGQKFAGGHRVTATLPSWQRHQRATFVEGADVPTLVASHPPGWTDAALVTNTGVGVPADRVRVPDNAPLWFTRGLRNNGFDKSEDW